MSSAVASVAARAVLTLALLALALVVGWWWRTFSEVVGYGYLSWGEAGRCLLRDNDICSLAKSLCLGSHPRSLYAYWSAAFWVSVAFLSAGCLLSVSRPSTPPRTS
jgi:hypothetical protein